MVEFLSFREDDATQEPTVTVEAFTGQSNSTAVRIEIANYSRTQLPKRQFRDRMYSLRLLIPATRYQRHQSPEHNRPRTRQRCVASG